MVGTAEYAGSGDFLPISEKASRRRGESFGERPEHAFAPFVGTTTAEGSLMPVTKATGEIDRRDDLHQRVEQFYARQMQLLDSGEVDDYVLTFTEDGSFGTNASPELARGRSGIRAGAEKAIADLARDGVVRRHWLGMLVVEPSVDGTVRARCYALVFETPIGGRSALWVSTLCEDVLVPEGDSWLVRERWVTRDDIR